MATVRRLNKRLVAALTVSIMLALTICIGVALMFAAKRTNPDVYGQRGDDFLAAGEYVKAARKYGSAYRVSNDPKWLIRIADAYYRGQDIGRAMGALQQAGIGHPNFIDAQKRLLEIHYEITYKLGGLRTGSESLKRLGQTAEKLLETLGPESENEPDDTRKLRAFALQCQGLGLYAQRTEAPEFEAKAQDTIKQAVEKDPQADYVQTLALICAQSAQEQARFAAAGETSIDAYGAYIKLMHEKLAAGEAFYLDVLQRVADDPRVHLSLGEFYNNIWAGLEDNLAALCQARAQKADSDIVLAKQQLRALKQDTTLSDTQKRHTRQRLNNEIGRAGRSIPKWHALAEAHTERAKGRKQKALAAYDQAATYAADTDDKISVLLAQAQYHRRAGEIQKAGEYARQAIELDPAGYQAYLIAAEVSRQQARVAGPDQAKPKITEAIDLLTRRLNDIPHQLKGPQGNRNRNLRSMLLLTVTELYFQRQDQGDSQRINANIQEIERELGEHPQTYLLKGRKALQIDRNPIEAIRAYEKADTLANQDSARIKLALADLYFRRREIGAAQKAIDQAMALNSNEPQALSLAARIYLRLGRPTRTLVFTQRLLAMPDLAHDSGTLGLKLQALINLGQLDQADVVAADLEKANPNFNWNVAKAEIFITQQKYADAENLLKNALADTPQHKTATALLAEIYVRQDRLDEARRLVDKALGTHPDDKRLQRSKELLAIDDREKRQQRLAEMREQLTEERMAAAMKTAQDETDPFLKAVRLFNYHLQRQDNDQARTYLDQARKVDAKRANGISFQFALATKDWDDLARKCAELAKIENLDTVGGALYDGQLANAKAWDLAMQKELDLAKGQFERSVQALERTIAELPNFALPRALLGEGYFWLGRGDEARTQIAKAADLNPNNPIVQRAQALLQWQVITESPQTINVQHVTAFARNVNRSLRQRPWDEWLKDKRAWLAGQYKRQLERQADEKDAADTVVARREKLRQERPDDLDNLLRLAWVYEYRQRVRDLDKAEQCYRQALTHESTGRIVSAYMGFANRHNKVENVETFLKKLADDQAKDKKPDGYTALAVFYQAVRNAEQAEQALIKAGGIRDDAEHRLRLARFYREVGNHEKAVEWAQKTLQADPDEAQQLTARTLLVEVLRQTGKWDQAEQHIEAFQKAHPKVPRGKLMQASLAMDRGQMSRAEQILADMLVQMPENIQALDLRATTAIFMWKLEQAKTDLEKLDRIAPRTLGLTATVRLAKLYCELDRAGDALKRTRILITALGDRQAAIDQVRRDLMPALSSALHPDQYEQLLVWAGSLDKNYWGWPYERGQLALREGDAAAAYPLLARAWQQIRTQRSQFAGVVFDVYMEALFKAGKYTTIMNETKTLLSDMKTPNPRLLAWQAAGLFKTSQDAPALETLLTMLEAAKDSPVTINQATHRYILKGIDHARLAALLEDKQAQRKDLASQIAQVLACCYFDADQIDKGRATLQQVADKMTDPLQKAVMLFVLGQELTRKARYEHAVEVLDQARELSPDMAPVLNNLAYILAEYLDRGQEAVDLIERAYRMTPNNADLLDTYGLVLDKTGQKEKAMFYLARSVWIRESAASRYHLGLQLLDVNRRYEAQLQLRRALALVSDDRQLEERIRDALGRI